jgi:hypothetical protein
MNASGWVPLRPDEPFVPQLLAASRARRGLTCTEAEIEAADLRAACLAADEAGPFGLRLTGARIIGRLDLSACTIPLPLRLESCNFIEPVDVRGATLHELAITGDPMASRPAVLPGLLAGGVQITRDLTLSGMVISGDYLALPENRSSATVWLTEADIGGSLIARGTQIRTATGRAMNADRIRVGGDIRMAGGFRANGEIRLVAMRLGGSLDLAGADLAPAGGRALDLIESSIGGSVYLLDSLATGRRCRVHGRIEMGHSTVRGQLFIRNADLVGPPAGTGTHSYNAASDVGRILLLAPRLTVEGAIRIEGDTVVHGGLLLPGAQLGGVKLAGAVWNPHDTALDLSQATLEGGLDASSMSIEGTVRLDSARVDGPIRLENATLTKPLDRRCLSAVGLTVTGDVELRGVSALAGALEFRSASITGGFDAENAFVTNPGDTTVSLYMAQVTGNVRLCRGFRSAGLVLLSRAAIGGRLRADGSVMAWSDPDEPMEPPGPNNRRAAAIDAVHAVIRGGMDLRWRVASGAVDFTGATTPYLADHPEDDWPADSYVGGFAYDRFEAVDPHGDLVWDADARIAWLTRMRRYDPRAWEHLATVLRTAGDSDGADAVLIAQRRRARRLRTGPRRFFDLLQDVTVRYGFRPQRALYLLVALIAAVTAGLSLPAVQAQMRATDQNALVFTTSGAQPLPDEHDPPGDCGNGKVRCLSPFFYAVDTVVPLIDLHQRSTWYPVAERNGVLLEWLLNLCTILGWIASTVFAVSFTRLGRAT